MPDRPRVQHLSIRPLREGLSRVQQVPFPSLDETAQSRPPIADDFVNRHASSDFVSHSGVADHRADLLDLEKVSMQSVDGVNENQAGAKTIELIPVGQDDSYA